MKQVVAPPPFDLPAVDPSVPPFDTGRSAVDSWAASLPRGDFGESARRIYRAVHRLNRQGAPWFERLHAMLVLDTHLGELEPALLRHYLDAPLPLRGHAHDVAELHRTLAREMLWGFQRVVRDLAPELFVREETQPLQLAVTLAMRYAGALLRVDHCRYAPALPGLWHDLHRLYAFAAKLGIEAQPAAPRGPELPTVTGAYCEALLFAAMGPEGFRPRELHGLLPLLRRLAGLPLLKREAGVAAFAADPETDTGPFPYPAEPPAAGLLLLDTRRAVQGVREATDPALPLERLAQRLAGPKRRRDRHPVDNGLDLAVGLSASARVLLNEGHPLEALLGLESTFASVPAGGGGGHRRVTARRRRRHPAPLRTGRWRAENVSGRGVRLWLDDPAAEAPAVGDVVAARADGVRRWHVGVVRWLASDADGVLNAGLELLPGEAHPVALRGNGSEGDYLPGIRLGTAAEPALLLPPLLAKGTLEAHDGQRSLPVRLVRELERTAGAARWSLEEVPPPAEGGDELDRLWRHI